MTEDVVTATALAYHGSFAPRDGELLRFGGQRPESVIGGVPAHSPRLAGARQRDERGSMPVYARTDELFGARTARDLMVWFQEGEESWPALEE